MNYVITVIVSALIGAAAYLAAWLLFGFAWHTLGLFGAALAVVVAVHALHVVHAVWTNGMAS